MSAKLCRAEQYFHDIALRAFLNSSIMRVQLPPYLHQPPIVEHDWLTDEPLPKLARISPPPYLVED